MIRLVASAALLLILGLVLYIRTAPDDPARWQVPVAVADAATPGPCADRVVPVPKGARATCLLSGTPDQVLARLDAVAMAAPRTTRLAGSVTEGRITWVQRSRLMAFPDYITAEVAAAPEGTRLDVVSRQRYGSSDLGVNAARLRDWLARL